jgi:hypothetical protein
LIKEQEALAKNITIRQISKSERDFPILDLFPEGTGNDGKKKVVVFVYSTHDFGSLWGPLLNASEPLKKSQEPHPSFEQVLNQNTQPEAVTQ